MKAYLYIIISYTIALSIGFLSYQYFLQDFNPLMAIFIADIICTIIIFIFSVIVNNSSVYDPYWSVIPPFILILWLVHFEFYTFTAIIILTTVLIWALRLTYNWAVNWKGFQHEDWRYVQFRKQFGKAYWLISLLGIHLFPTVMVFLGMMPLYYALKIGSIEYMLGLLIGVAIALLGVMISYLADIHLTKHRNSENRRKAITIGIWKYSRHPNYLGEVTFWLGCFIIGFSFDSNNYFTVIGFLAMLLLFNLFSIPVMEKRLQLNKNDYLEIKRTIPKLIPIKINFFKRENLIEK